MQNKMVTVPILGRPVTFHAPPHDEADFLWVDCHDLVVALLGDVAAADAVLQCTEADDAPAPPFYVRREGRVSAFVCHPMAQALAEACDAIAGNTDIDADDHGPLFHAFCKVAAKTNFTHWRLPIADLIAAAQNPGGPTLRNNKGGNHV